MFQNTVGQRDPDRGSAAPVEFKLVAATRLDARSENVSASRHSMSPNLGWRILSPS
jgi:hypothetical protein